MNDVQKEREDERTLISLTEAIERIRDADPLDRLASEPVPERVVEWWQYAVGYGRLVYVDGVPMIEYQTARVD